MCQTQFFYLDSANNVIMLCAEVIQKLETNSVARYSNCDNTEIIILCLI